MADNNTLDEDTAENGEGGVEGYAECGTCGDHIMTEFLSRHMRMNHGVESSQASPKAKPIVMRACPVCNVEMKSDAIVKHCKAKHKVIIHTLY